jgi:hypothetical protein
MRRAQWWRCGRSDAYGEEEQPAGFYRMIEKDLVLPFTTRVVGTMEGI